MTWMLRFAAVIPFLPILSFLMYGVAALAAERHRRRSVGPPPATVDDFFFVFVVPCLNEELVIAASLDRLLALPGRNISVLVIDDGSDDATAGIVARYTGRDRRVHLLRRRAPNARKGKGAALNTGYHHLRSTAPAAAAGYDDDHVVVVVVDADGRLQPDALDTVAPLFGDPRTGAVQVGVRMYNRASGWLARMQDMEFLVFTEIFQRARQRCGNAGLGGNGQFVRLSALQCVGDDPWTDFLTEDLDMGLRLQARGWRTRFTPATYVSQEGLAALGPLIRQRTRWYQGHLQCWYRIPELLSCGRLSAGRTVDLMIYLISPITVLLITLSLIAYLPRQAYELITRWDETVDTFLAHRGLLLWWYLLVFCVIPLIAYIYWRACKRSTDDVTLPQSLIYAFLFSVYAYLWLPVGWRATARLLRRDGSWAKTQRIADQPPTGAPAPADGPLVARN
jgi:cellulose synthase/poly-beta-1,6-N-acetylglucosamine synthase-like glycosyltransferase